MRGFLALGDSYTIGEGVAEEQRWPQRLVAGLRARGVNLDPPEVIAATGWTTDELAAAIDRQRPARTPYALVSLLVGVNNQYRGRSSEEFRGEFRGLLARAVGFAGGNAARVLVLSIPDWGKTPFAEGRDRVRIASEIGQFNRVVREEAGEAGARFVDITDETPREPGSEWLAGDGLHPSGAEYARWSERLLPVAATMLG